MAAISDQSGLEERFYGRLGEVVKESKTVLSDTPPLGTEGPYVTQYLYDTFGRLQQMVYPDGEVLSYGYDAGGLLRSAQGTKANRTYVYVKRMEYDRFEQRAFVQYGNNVRATYTYDPLNRRLTNLHSLHGASLVLQDLNYAYDNVGNILSLTNAVPVPPTSEIGGPTSQSYSYDDLYRLTRAEGSFQQAAATQMYRLDQSYDSVHNITRKQQIHEKITPSGTVIPQQGTSYYWTYAYEGMRPHAPSRIGDRAFFYDANGNQTGWLTDGNNTRRNIVWDEENRIRSISDGGETTTFKYNDRGERVVKRGSKGETSYVNQYFTVKNGSQASKHIFAGTTRVVTQMVRPFSPPGGGNGNGPPQGPGPPNPPGPPEEEKEQFFYHPDHLGSTNYVTDYQGKLYEHVEYFPFGETWVQEALNTDVTPYLFTSKILDAETGLYYFGARYYDPRTSVWQSPDPVLGEYLPRINKKPKKDTPPELNSVFTSSTLNLFGYPQQNPIRFVDKEGKFSDPVAQPELRTHYGSPPHEIRAPVRSGFGMTRSGGLQGHGGLDLRTNVGERNVAVGNGVVVHAGRLGGFGNTVVYRFTYDYSINNIADDIERGVDPAIIDFKTSQHGQTFYALHGHLQQVAPGIQQGQEITEGQLLGTTGASGNAATLPAGQQHLHFEILTQWPPGEASRSLRDRQDPSPLMQNLNRNPPDNRSRTSR